MKFYCPLFVGIYARGQGKDSNGMVVSKGNLLEFSLNWEDLALYEDVPNKLDLANHYGEGWSDDHEDRASRSEKIQLTGDPTPMLAWLNKGWQSGTDKIISQYRVPFNLISIDRDPSDWIHLPVIASNNRQSYSDSLQFLKTAVDEEFFYLFLQSPESWDKNREHRVDLDFGAGITGELILNKRKVEMLTESDTISLNADLQWGGNFLEVRIPLSEMGSPAFCNVMQVSQEEGNSIPVFPYY